MRIVGVLSGILSSEVRIILLVGLFGEMLGFQGILIVRGYL